MSTAIGPPLERALEACLAACRRLRTEREADALLSLLAAVLDPEIRLHRFGEYLRRRSAGETAWTLAYVRERLVCGDSRAQRVGLVLLDRDRLARVLPAGQLRAAAECLRRRGHVGAALLDDGPLCGDATGDDALPRPKEPVGYRISLARRALAGVLERLLFDPDSRVVRTLLGNPRLTEAEVVKLAASRRASAEALEALVQDDRWIARYAVKIALANNPATPTRVVLALLPHLMSQDLREVAVGAARADVREHAASLLARRTPWVAHVPGRNPANA